MSEAPYSVGDSLKIKDGSVWTVEEEVASFRPNSHWIRIALTTPAPQPFVPGWYRAVYPGCPSDYITKFATDPRQDRDKYEPVPKWGTLEFDKAWQRVHVEDIYDTV